MTLQWKILILKTCMRNENFVVVFGVRKVYSTLDWKFVYTFHMLQNMFCENMVLGFQKLNEKSCHMWKTVYVDAEFEKFAVTLFNVQFT